MKKINEFFSNSGLMIAAVFSFLTFVNTCSDPNKVTNKKIVTLTQQIDSLKAVVATRKDLKVEGLKAEKRMIQSTNRKMMDVNRQTEIDNEIQNLEGR